MLNSNAVIVNFNRVTAIPWQCIVQSERVGGVSRWFHRVQ
jgi:hypothetical protein